MPKKLGPRIHIHKDMIFLYDPFWLEREDGTYLIDWAEREDADKLKKHLKGKENPAAIFQLFSFPVHRVCLFCDSPCAQTHRSDFQRGWVWNGAHQFRVTEGLPAIWPQLRQKAGVNNQLHTHHFALLAPMCHPGINRSLIGKTEVDEQDTASDARQVERDQAEHSG